MDSNPDTKTRSRTAPLPDQLPRFGGHADALSASFTVYAVADVVRVRLLHPGTRSLVVRDLENVEHPDIWHGRISGDFRGWTYTYELVRGEHEEGGILDPHAALISHGSCVLAHDETPVADPPELDPGQAVIYELHVRDFTNHPTSGVRPEWRGAYVGLTEPGTGCEECPEEGHITTGLDHLKELGVTVVQLMPVHTFSYIHHNRYDWGYMPEVFTSPHEPYASSTDIAAPLREFKQLVSAIHESGMRVTIDMVVNHTSELWPARRHSLMSLAPREYFRFTDTDNAADGSGCGNEIASEHPVARDLIVRACERWVTEFGVDGFRFDLMGLMDLDTIDRVVHSVRAHRPGALIYGEPWAAGPSPARVTTKGDQRSRGFAVFNDEFRDAARGNVFEEHAKGFLTHGVRTDDVKRTVRGSVESFTDSPLESINFLEVHDNHTLADRVRMLTPDDDERTRMRALGLGAYYLLASAGIPLIHAGQEFARTQKMIGNAYDRADAINNIDWSIKQRNIALVDLYRALIALRLDHPILRLSTREHASECIDFLDDLDIDVPAGVVAWRTENPGLEDTWARACVVLNGTREDHEVALPENGNEWLVEMVEFEPEYAERATGNRLTIPALSGAVVYQANVQ